MKLSELLFSKTKDLWIVSANKPFVIGMAKNTLPEELFKRYMIQDYLYICDYVGILCKIQDLADNNGDRDFLEKIINETRQEAERVHLPNLASLGITKDEVLGSAKLPAVSGYIGYMQNCLDEHGLLGGLTALLQCSWVYAFIGEEVSAAYPDEISKSRYRSWFESYSCQSYLDTNQMWIDMLDKSSTGMDDTARETMCRIFRQCAIYENELWDALFK